MQSFINPVSCKYGAPLGRYTGPDYLDTDAGKIYLRPDYLDTDAGKIYLRRVHLDTGGYDNGGAYWGHGAPLWEAMDQGGNGRIFRASNRDKAKACILADFPDATFYR